MCSQQLIFLNSKIIFFDEISVTCDERLVSHGVSLNDPPVYWKLPSRNDFHDIAPLHQLNIHLLLTGAQIGYCQ